MLNYWNLDCQITQDMRRKWSFAADFVWPVEISQFSSDIGVEQLIEGAHFLPDAFQFVSECWRLVREQPVLRRILEIWNKNNKIFYYPGNINTFLVSSNVGISVIMFKCARSFGLSCALQLDFQARIKMFRDPGLNRRSGSVSRYKTGHSPISDTLLLWPPLRIILTIKGVLISC
jgi:hypothetical protein